MKNHKKCAWPSALHCTCTCTYRWWLGCCTCHIAWCHIHVCAQPIVWFEREQSRAWTQSRNTATKKWKRSKKIESKKKKEKGKWKTIKKMKKMKKIKNQKHQKKQRKKKKRKRPPRGITKCQEHNWSWKTMLCGKTQDLTSMAVLRPQKQYLWSYTNYQAGGFIICLPRRLKKLIFLGNVIRNRSAIEAKKNQIGKQIAQIQIDSQK